ncbi:MAG: hypothetical protein AB4426_26590 [Xenococcaceae cyanobacterium]
MLNGYHIIDADSHVYEPHSLWQTYLEGLKQSCNRTVDTVTILV